MVNTRSKTKKTCFSQASMDSAAFVVSNDDLLTEILLRLPAKSILRFKSVSKHWRLLLTHTHFTRRYDNNSLSKSPRGLFARRFHNRNAYVPFNMENPNTTPFNGFDFFDDPYGIIAVQSCNGLLLCCSHTQRRMRVYRTYYVFNPTTKQFAVIPPVIGGQRARKAIGFMGLAFHPTDFVHYKLVYFRALNRYAKSYQIQIYSSETRKWKISIKSVFVDDVFKQGFYWNGALYLAHYECPYYECPYWCFKLDDEQLQMLSLPEELIPKYIGESGGHLHLILCEKNSFNVYEMSRDHSGWFVKYQLELIELLAAFPKIVGRNGNICFKVIDVVRGETEEDTFMVLKTEENIITCNIHDKSFKHIFTLPENNFNEHDRYTYENFPRFHCHTETLTSF